MRRALWMRMVVVVVLGMMAGAAWGQGGGQLLVAQKGTQALGIVDVGSGRVMGTVPEGGITGHEVAASPDGKTAYIPIYGNSGVGKPGTDGREMVVVDLPGLRVMGRVDFGHGVRPHDPVVGRDGMLYVTTELDKTVTVIDPRTLTVVGAIPTGAKESHMLAVSKDGRRGYTANVGAGSVSVLDLDAKKLVTVIPVAAEVQRIALSADDRWVFTADQKEPRMAVIDTGANAVKGWIPLSSPGYGAAATRDGKWLLVAEIASKKVAVVDLTGVGEGKAHVVTEIAVPAAPQAVLIRPDGKDAYVSCDASGQVAEIEIGTWKVTRLIAAGKGPDGMAWAVGDRHDKQKNDNGR